MQYNGVRVSESDQFSGDSVQMSTQYKAIANQFSYQKSGDCVGKVIVSSAAVYLVPGTVDDLLEQETTTVLPAVGPASIGIALASADFKRIVAKFKQKYEETLTDLRGLVESEGNWPIRADVQGIILHRKDVSRMKYPWWGALSIKAGDAKATVKPIFTARSRVLSDLRELGWAV